MTSIHIPKNFACSDNIVKLVVIVPAAGIGKRMQADVPKQYLTINGLCILTHTVNRLLSHNSIAQVIICISKDDPYFAKSSLNKHPQVKAVYGGAERVDSVLAGLHVVDEKHHPWVLVHDAARPCVSVSDIDKLIKQCLIKDQGGILASPVRDTMKRATTDGCVATTVDRSYLWHAMTPQMFKTEPLKSAIERALIAGVTITDESSAMEFSKQTSMLIEGSQENIKITHPDDLLLAEMILTKQQKQVKANKKTHTKPHNNQHRQGK